MLERKMVTREQLRAYDVIEPDLIRFPAMNSATFRGAVLAVCQPADNVSWCFDERDAKLPGAGSLRRWPMLEMAVSRCLHVWFGSGGRR